MRHWPTRARTWGRPARTCRRRRSNKLIAPGIASGSVAPATLDHIRQGTGRIIFTASGVDEESLESDSIQHGYFTYFLVQALEQQNGTVSLSQAFAYVQHVRTRAQTEAHAAQNPVMSRSEDSTDFTLGGAPASAAVLRRPQAAIAAMLR